MSASTPQETKLSQPTSAVAAAGTAGFPVSFWILNTIEMFERLAFFTFRVVAPIYIMQADNPGGLHLTAGQKGTIYAWWAVFQSILPIVTGGIADRYGYKRTLMFAFALMTGGYLGAAFLRDFVWVTDADPAKALAQSNFYTLFISIMVLATGTAFFKPALQGSLAQNLTKANSSLGWGIFYMVVNIGGIIGPFVSTYLLAKPPQDSGMSPDELVAFGKAAWRNLLLAAAAFAAFNFLLLAVLKDVPSGADKSVSLFTVLERTIVNFFEPRLLVWILIMSGFWLMMYQLWDLQPNFIADWVDSGPIAQSLQSLPQGMKKFLIEHTPHGPQIPQQILLNANAAFIILLMVPIAWATRKMRTLSAMTIGMITATIGIIVAGWTMSAWILLFGILLFSLGEMTTGPKKNEYLGLIAPPGKKGLYLGYVNIPVGIGVGVGSTFAAYLYGNFGEKATLALKYMLEKTPLGAGKQWDGDVKSLESVLSIKRSDAMLRFQEAMNLDYAAATQLLWDTYHPQYIWLAFAAIGVICTIALAIFAHMAKRWNDMNA
ncbi:MAG: MFS transporter [Phycisphaerales bacterium]|nr:MFS transporter [Phycisphaerales bacterium]